MTRKKEDTPVKLRKRATKPSDDLETVSYQLRLDADLHQQLKQAAEVAGISLNQLIQGICRGAMAHIVQGEAEVSKSGVVRVKPQRGCVFFGRKCKVPDDPHVRSFMASHDDKPPCPIDKGEVWFGLDFTNRGFVRYQPK